MRRVIVVGILGAIVACGGAGNSGFGNDGQNGGPDGGTPPDMQGNPPPSDLDGSTPPIFTGDGAPGPMDSGAIVTTKTIVYAHTDNTLYSMDPMTMMVTPIGAFSGTSDASTDGTVTDLAVNLAGDVYVNTESAIYKANVPSSPGTVNLTNKVPISGGGTAKFVALAFAPPNVLGSGETLVAGDTTGTVWAVDPASGAAKNLGNFGKDPSGNGNTLELSGDIVFYLDASNNPTGMATIRSCGPNSAGKTVCGNDWLAGIDMNALTTAYTSGTAASSLLGGVYGGSSSSLGNGTGFYEVFGLAAWEGNVYGFTRAGSSTNPAPPKFISISTATGAGTMISSSFPFTTGGWSGAGVSTKTTITIPPPPPPPPQPK
jgi:hypothetical protein